MTLQDLKKEIPFKWRVQSTSQYGSNCVAYVDARDVQDLLDDVCGAENWQCKYKEHKGNLFCSIGILTNTIIPLASGNIQKEVWVWKSDCGTESNIEKQKGESSDAFKRAAVMWGVGRFLYSLTIIKIKEVIKDVNGKFHPAVNGVRIWDINSHCNTIHLGKKTTGQVTGQVDRKEALTIANFEKSKLGTKEQIKNVLDTFRMTPIQRSELKELL